MMPYAILRKDADFDVVVVGAGPAGAAAACHLARSGASVVLLDRAKFPRDKVCGDFVGPAALVELGLLGVSGMDGYSRTNIGRRAALHLDGQELICQPFPKAPGSMPLYGRVIPRLALDQLIVNAARNSGVRVMDGFPLVGFLRDERGVTVATRGPAGVFAIRARLMVAADGSSSAVARAIRGSSVPRRDRIVAARAYFENIEGPEDRLDIYFNRECFPGYYWLFPTGRGEANVGLGMALETLPAFRETPAAALQRLMRSDNALASRLKNAKLRGKVVGWPLITYNPRLPIVADRIVLIGDAAGLINPLNGEGIQYALQSARWAAETIAPRLRDGDFSEIVLTQFTRRVETELRYDMALARLIVQFISHRAATPVSLEALQIIIAKARRDPDYSRIAAGILAGSSPARHALKLSFISGTLNQAARSLALNSLFCAKGGPNAWGALGIDVAQIGFQFGFDAIALPADLAGWTTSLASGLAELAALAVGDTIRGRKEEALPAVRITSASHQITHHKSRSIM
jgi:menaquinone-9 beta-reductase